MTMFEDDRCEQAEITCAYALEVLPVNEAAAAEAHIAGCADCRRERAQDVGGRGSADRSVAHRLAGRTRADL